MQSFARRERAQRAAAVVGVDAGKYHHAMVVRPRGRPDSRALLFPTTRPGFESAVRFIHDTIGTDPAPGEVLVGIEFAGMYGFTFAHYLHALGSEFGIVAILPAHTKRWKEVTHGQPLKTDAKDAAGITDLAAQGHFVAFPFLATTYAELRYLLSARERLSTLRRGTITRLRTSLDVVFPEFADFFASVTGPTARATPSVPRPGCAPISPAPAGRCAAPAKEPPPPGSRAIRHVARRRSAYRRTPGRPGRHEG
jgi:hypothetical protein